MSLALSEAHFSLFIQFLKEDVSSLPIVKAIAHIGEQSSGVWVLNNSIQIDASGQLINENDREYIWLEEAFSDKYGNIALQQLIPLITIPLNTDVLYTYIKKLTASLLYCNYVKYYCRLIENMLQHNFMPLLLILGGMIAGFRYYSLKSGSCPIIVAKGESQTRKSTTVRIAMNLIGKYIVLVVTFTPFVQEHACT